MRTRAATPPPVPALEAPPVDLAAYDSLLARGGVMTALAVTAGKPSALDALLVLLRALKLPAFARYSEEIASKATREGWTFGQYLQHLAELEVDERRVRRIDRALRDSDLPSEKTLATLDRARAAERR